MGVYTKRRCQTQLKRSALHFAAVRGNFECVNEHILTLPLTYADHAHGYNTTFALAEGAGQKILKALAQKVAVKNGFSHEDNSNISTSFLQQKKATKKS